MPAKIVTFEDKFSSRGVVPSRVALAAKFPSSVGDRTPPTSGVALDVTAEAFVSGGRWIAMCPCDSCNGAEYVSFDDPYLFCHECRNAGYGHQLVQVAVPDAKKRRDIEAYLVARPVPATRNWASGDPVTKLRDENQARGIRLLKDNV